MNPLRRLLVVPLTLFALLRLASAAEPIAGLRLEDNFAAYENVLLRALGEADEAWEKKAGTMPAFDPQAAAMKAGDWARADAEIVTACEAHGVTAILTRSDHVNGSDRLAEACEQLGLEGSDIVVNVQGDLPTLDPKLVAASVVPLADPAIDIATVVAAA